MSDPKTSKELAARLRKEAQAGWHGDFAAFLAECADALDGAAPEPGAYPFLPFDCPHAEHRCSGCGLPLTEIRGALQPDATTTGVGDYCTVGPASEQAQKFLLMFEDRDRGVSIYPDETQARAAFAQAEGRGWNCHLFGLLRRAAPPSGAATFQDDVHEWMLACFDLDTVANKVERNHRFLEESLELVQSLGCTWEEARMLVDYVFSRDVGEPVQETGGVMVTLAALGNANDIRIDGAALMELKRCWDNIPKIRAKQAGKPRHSPLPGPTSTKLPEGQS